MPDIDAVLLGKESETLATQIACVDSAQQFQIKVAASFEAVEQCIDKQNADSSVLFLSGDDVLHHVKNASDFVQVVVVSELKERASELLSLGATDFLPLPLSSARLHRCLDHFAQLVSLRAAKQQNDRIDALLRRKNGMSIAAFLSALENLKSSSLNELCSTLCVKSGSDWIRLNLEEILWFEAAGDYVCIYTQSGSHIVCRPLKQFENELCGDTFKRVSRSVIVNLANVKGFTQCHNGGLQANIQGDHQVKVGRRYRHTLDMVSP
ncbi:hypothetical protein DRW07_13230 [Alteromonas sediminis]|uniref:HTH LytTR-type domain-containing protein n=1 Tax=Alteromonas sediminis TaxID=2259342 RepID=A0A3N5XY11_9ALTE|nr:LytTR family DNA-binding domain-containing protein [Alteromonas sediminis]RPJ65772.1 hypothetical protein DRW07_13230 [Alteromonas sediminis]